LTAVGSRQTSLRIVFGLDLLVTVYILHFNGFYVNECFLRTLDTCIVD
jgi:hypothetical protein